MKVRSLLVIIAPIFLAAPARAADSITEQYKEPAERIIRTVLSNNDAYNKLEELCDDIGHRFACSSQLDEALRWAVKKLETEGHTNVRLESVTLPHWVRGEESCRMVAPYELDIPMLGLGYSVGTPPSGITASVLCVHDDQELKRRASEAKGKIILFDYPMHPYTEETGTGYGDAVRFRSNGARWAAEVGGVAALVRSVTARSLRTPHTGVMHYGEADKKVPTAAITVEDSERIHRLTMRGKEVILTLKMDAENRGECQSANVVAEIRGAEHPEQIVIISGHIDSWDVGQGAQDDGGGAVMAMEALNTIRKMNLRPRRTIRCVLWTAEEIGLLGAKQYAEDHADEFDRYVAAIEADFGSFRPTGFGISCKDKGRAEIARKQMREILDLCRQIGPLEVTSGSAPDISRLQKSGAVLLGQDTAPEHYFDYHHTPADTLDKVDPEELSQNVALMATVAYIIADMPEKLGEE